MHLPESSNIDLEKSGAPIRTWNFLLRKDAVQNQARIDFLDGEEILLHVKPVPEQQRIVVNNRGAGGWGNELRLPATSVLLSRDLELALLLWPDHLEIHVPGAGSLRYNRHLERLSSATKRLSAGVTPVLKAADFDPARLQADILRADCMHVMGRLHNPDAELLELLQAAEARLLLLIDGRPSGTAPVPRVQGDNSPGFILEAEMGALICDGMVADVALEVDGRRFRLASAPIKSRFAGGLERCSEAVVSGFACNPELPQRPVLVDIFLNNAFQATVPASLPRPDLARLGLEADVGFQFRFSTPVQLPVSVDAWVSVRVHNTDLELANSPWWVCRAVQRDDAVTMEEAEPSPDG